MLRDVYPVTQGIVAHFRIRDLIFEDAIVLFDNLAGSDVANIGGQEDALNAKLFCFRQRKFKHFISVPVSPFGWSDIKTNMTADDHQAVVQPMTYSESSDKV